jgi:nucleoside-diphosphate-sugar epimerase
LNILITGGNGFIGSHVSDSLTGKGHDVTLLDTHFTSNTSESKCRKIIGDITKPELYRGELQTQEVVIHLAAMSRVEWGENDPLTCIRVNLTGTLHLLESLDHDSKTFVIYGSSREVYGEPQHLPVQESDFKRPISVYGVSKLGAENLVGLYGSRGMIKSVLLRFSNVYGSERDIPERVVPRFMREALQARPLTLNGGDQVLDFTFIDDVVAGIVKTVDMVSEDPDSINGEDFNFANGVGFSIKDLAKLVNEISGANVGIEVQPARRHDVQRFYGDYSKANRILGFEPKYGLRQGLQIYKERLTSRDPSQTQPRPSIGW